MKRSVIVLISIVLLAAGFCGCGEGDSGVPASFDVHEVTKTIDSTDEVTVNDLCMNLLEFDDNDVFTEVQINFTSKFDFDCSTVGIGVNLLDKNNSVIESTYATLDNVRSGQSGDASVTLNSNTDLKRIKTIEICSYCAWTQSDDDVIEIEGTFTENPIFDIEDIPVNNTSF